MILSQFHCLEVDAQHSSAVCILSLSVDGLAEKSIWFPINHRRFAGTLEKGQVRIQLQFSSCNLSFFPISKSWLWQKWKTVLALETECVDSVDTRSTKKLTINVPNYTFKVNNAEFNPSLDSGSSGARCSPLPCLNLLVSSGRNTVS